VFEAFGHRTGNTVGKRAKRFGLNADDIFTNGAHVSSMVTKRHEGIGHGHEGMGMGMGMKALGTGRQALRMWHPLETCRLALAIIWFRNITGVISR
jgi:membrane protease subunit (stomatin/prohibitin family)